MSSIKRILVTGGAGFLGSHLCERLVAAGHDVIVCDHGSGHTVPRALTGSLLVNFFQSHPRGTVRSPWGMTPPTGLPSYCRYSAGAP